MVTLTSPAAKAGTMPEAGKMPARRKKMRAAVDHLRDYVGTYNEQAHYQDYTDKTYVDDILYGLGLSMQHLIPSDFYGAGGYERFKQYLREHLK